MSKRSAAGNDRHLMDGIGHRESPPDQSVAGLVIRNHQLLFFGDQPALAFRSGDHSFDRFFEFIHRDLGFGAPGGEDGRLVDQVGQIGTGKTGGLPS